MLELIGQHLSAPNQKMAESAIVALGIMGDPACVQLLADIAGDTDAGRKRLGRESVPGRTRPLAALSLGITGPLLEDEDSRRSLVGELEAILLEAEGASPDLHVACVTSLGMTALQESGADDERGDPGGPVRAE